MELEAYIKELKEDVIVNEMNLKEKSLSLPALKAKWVSRLIKHKNILNRCQEDKKRIIKEAVPQIQDKLPVKLSTNFVKEKAEELTTIIEINKRISYEESIIDFLERAEKVISSMSYDLSNIIKIVQLETV